MSSKGSGIWTLGLQVGKALGDVMGHLADEALLKEVCTGADFERPVLHPTSRIAFSALSFQSQK